MKLTIIPIDNTVYIDGVSHVLNLTTCGIPANVHALQWNTASGWIEYTDNPDGTKDQNQPITTLPDWANNCVAAWNAWTSPAPPIHTVTNQPTTTGTKAA